MFLNDRIYIPHKRQHHEHKNRGLFSLCQRKYIKWRYSLSNKATHSLMKIIWLIISAFIFTIVISSKNIFHETDSSLVYEHHTSDKRYSPGNVIDSTKDKYVYKTIRNWQLSAVDNNVDMLPKLSPLRDQQWLKYKDNELFEWKEVPLNFVHERLKHLDIENQKESGYYTNSDNKYGDLGSNVTLSGHLREEASAKFSMHQINVVASNIMSLNRRLPEVRNPK